MLNKIIENLITKCFEIKNPYESGILKIVDLEDTINAIKLASKPNWYNPLNNEFPENRKYIRVVSKFGIYDTFIFYDVDLIQNTLETVNKASLLKYAYWCYLPKFINKEIKQHEKE